MSLCPPWVIGSPCRRVTGIVGPWSRRAMHDKPFDDVRVRRALTLAIDRWHGARRCYVYAAADGRWDCVPGVTSGREPERSCSSWPDIAGYRWLRAEARRLLKEAAWKG